MPLNVKRSFTSIFVTFLSIVGVASGQAPANQTTPPPVTNPLIAKQPTSAEVMRDRISKAKAYIAVRNYNAAIYELENIRRESSDTSVNAVTNVLLMNSYLEQGDYKRAQDFLNGFFKSYKSNNANGNLYYSAVAGQIVKSARNQVERYRALGLNVADRNLPLEAVNDVERMRETLEVVITQSKELSSDKAKSSGAMALLEEAANSRAMIARDDYDARRWRDELGDSREQMANSRSVIISAVDGTTVGNPAAQPQVAATNPPASTVANNQPATAITNAAVSQPVVNKPAETNTAVVNDPVVEQPKPIPTTTANDTQRNRLIENKPTVDATMQTVAAKSSETPSTPPVTGPVEVGSLLAYATSRQAPVYPPAARSMRATGVVKVQVTVSETGDVTDVQTATGPTLLQAAAKDAIRKWKFKPFVRDGQPVKANGFVNFNFSL